MTPHRHTAVGTAALALLALFGGVRPLAAQRLNVSPAIGVYVPTTELYTSIATGEEFKQQVSISFGGRVGLWFGERFGIEGTGMYAPGKLKFDTSGLASDDANVFTGSGRATFFVIPNTSPIYFAVSGGVGYIKRSGAAYQDVADSLRHDWAGTAGAKAGFRLGKLLHLEVAAEDYIYTPKAADTPGLEGKRQNDVHLSFAVGIPILGLGR